MAIDTKKCEGCAIHGMHVPVTTVGPDDARFLVVTDVPSQAAAKEKRLLPPGSLRVFAGEMKELGFGQEDFRFVPSCFCAYDQDVTPNKVKTAIHKHCRQHLVDEVRKTNPEVIIPLGALPSTQAIGRATKITKVRGLPQESEEFHRPIFPLLSPAQVVMYPQNHPIFRADVQSFGRFFDHGYDAASASTEHGEYIFVDDLQFLIDQDPEIIAFDTENTSLRHYQRGVDVRTFTEERRKDPTFIPRAQILTMQFCIEPGKAYILRWDHPENPIPEEMKPKLRNQLRKLLCKPSRIVIGQNLKYDSGYLKATEGIQFRIGGDTLMLAQLVDENAMEKNLDVLTKIYAPEMAGYADRFSATHDKSRMWEIPLDEIRAYGCGDADAVYRVYAPLEDLVWDDQRLWQHYIRVSLPGLNGFVGLESRGMHVDTHGAMHEFRDVLTEEVERQRQSIMRQIPREIKLKHLAIPRFKGNAEKALALSRQELLQDILFKHPAGFKLKPKVFTDSTAKLPDHLKEPSTSSKDHLPFFFDTCPFTFELAEYVKNERLLSTNVIGFEQKYVVDGMVRGTYGLTKTVTGRSNSDDPNCFPGYVEVLTDTGWVRFDEAQASLNIAQYDVATGEIDFVKPLNTISYQYVGMMHYIETEQFIDTVCTADHRMLVQDRKTGEFRFKPAARYPKDMLQYHAGMYVGGPVELRESQITLIAALQADANINPSGGIDWAFSKTRKADRLAAALDAEGIPYRRYRSKEVYDRFYVSRDNTPDWLVGWKLFDSRILQFSRKTLSLFCQELWHWDGDYTRRSTWTSTIEENAKWVQIAFTLSGSRAWVREACNQTCKRFYVVNVTEQKPFSNTTNHSNTSLHTATQVYCYTMPKETLIVRHNGKVMITGNCQNFPKRGKMAKTYGKQFVAPEGWYMIAPDLSQAELRIAASMANEPTMIEIYRNNGDIHRATAMIAMDIGEEEFSALAKDVQKAARQKAKAINFGFLYGMWWKKFIIYAKTQYNVEFTDKEAKAVRERFFKKYKKLEPWHNRVKEFVAEHGYMRSYTGRVRHLPTVNSPEDWIVQEAMRQGINSPVQETGSSLGVMAIGRINEEIDAEFLPIVGFIHDSIIAYVRKEHLDWGLKTLVGYMQSTPMRDWFGTEIKVPIVADASFGLNFGELIECPGFRLDQPYDFHGLVDDKGRPLETARSVPRQIVPPNNGRLTRSVYTLDTDLEDELNAAEMEDMVDNVIRRVRRTRPLARAA